MLIVVVWELVEFAEVCRVAEFVESEVACKVLALVAVSVGVLRWVEDTFYLEDCCCNLMDSGNPGLLLTINE